MTMKCKVCGKNSESEYCFHHKPRKPLKKERESSHKEGTLNPLHLFFLEIWRKRLPFSEVSGTYLGKAPLSTFFHHILEKEKYPEYAFDEENVILVTLDEHTDVHTNMYKYEEINRRRENLKCKYNL